MAYLGKGLKSISTANITVDKMTGNGSTTTMGISLGNQISGSVNDINVYISGVQQRPGTDYTLSGSTITFTTAPANGWPVVAISKGDSIKDDVIDSSVTSESIKDGAVTDAKITSVTASKLTGALPALDGSALTGIVAYTKSASNPTISTNPAGGLGTVWVNQSSGQVYVCTDATAGANIWTNIGGGSGNVEPFSFPGSNFGYASGGIHGGSSTQNVIEKYSFTSQANAVDTGGNLVPGLQHHSSHRSETHAYHGGGDQTTNNIQKFSFASGGDAVDSGSTLSTNRSRIAGASSGTHGYALSGTEFPAFTYFAAAEKFSYASAGAASFVGNMTQARGRPAGHSSGTHGYASGGDLGSSKTNVIDRVSFASDGNATDHGDLSEARACRGSGGSSTTHGYTVGGDLANNNSTVIDKWAFASNTTATDWGDFHTAARSGSTTSATDAIYFAGGRAAGTTDINQIQKWSLASGGTAADWADITINRYGLVGNHY